MVENCKALVDSIPVNFFITVAFYFWVDLNRFPGKETTLIQILIVTDKSFHIAEQGNGMGT